MTDTIRPHTAVFLLPKNFQNQYDWTFARAGEGAVYSSPTWDGPGLEYFWLEADGDYRLGLSGHYRPESYTLSYLTRPPGGETTTGTVEVTFYEVWGSKSPVNLRGGSGNDLIVGVVPDQGRPTQTLWGGEGDDLVCDESSRATDVFGGSGDDRLMGSSGDKLFGGAGDDIYRSSVSTEGNGGFKVVETAGGGIDSLYGTSLASVQHVENLYVANYYDGTGNDGANILRRLPGMRFDSGMDSLFGMGGDDQLYGNDGKDWLDGGAGRDRLAGGRGNDVYVLGAGDTVVELAGGGRDLARSNASCVLGAEVEGLHLTGAQASDGWGNALANNLTGNSYGNRLYGGDRGDTLLGEAGADSLFGGRASDHLAGGLGSDRLRGEDGDDRLFGNDGDDRLEGGTGRDTLNGGAGLDQAYGGDGDDLLEGRDGDSLYGGAGHDVHRLFNSGSVIEGASGGTDLAILFGKDAVFQLGPNVENAAAGNGSQRISIIGNGLANVLESQASHVTEADRSKPVASFLRLEGQGGDDVLKGSGTADRLFGGSGMDRLEGGDGSDTLDGGTGADRLEGGVGADVYVVNDAGDRIIEGVTHRDEQIDVIYSSVSWTISQWNGRQADHLILVGKDPLRGTGNINRDILEGNAASNSLSGLGGDDTVYGAGGNDHVLGGDGQDFLEGGLGDDRMTGGAGRDHFNFGEGRDRVMDFQLNTDTLTFDRSLLGGVPDSDDDVLRFGRIRDGNAVFDFGDGQVLTLLAVTSLNGLRGELYYI